MNTPHAVRGTNDRFSRTRLCGLWKEGREQASAPGTQQQAMVAGVGIFPYLGTDMVYADMRLLAAVAAASSTTQFVKYFFETRMQRSSSEYVVRKNSDCANARTNYEKPSRVSFWRSVTARMRRLS